MCRRRTPGPTFADQSLASVPSRRTRRDACRSCERRRHARCAENSGSHRSRSVQPGGNAPVLGVDCRSIEITVFRIALSRPVAPGLEHRMDRAADPRCLLRLPWHRLPDSQRHRRLRRHGHHPWPVDGQHRRPEAELADFCARRFALVRDAGGIRCLPLAGCCFRAARFRFVHGSPGVSGCGHDHERNPVPRAKAVG